MSKNCEYSRDQFCFVCGVFILNIEKSYKLRRASLEAYKLHFNLNEVVINEPWIPTRVCGHCETQILGWHEGDKRPVTLTEPKIWRESTNHPTDCCFCSVKTCKKKSAHKTESMETATVGECSYGSYHVCSHKPDKFCFVCGEFLSTKKGGVSVANAKALRDWYTRYYKLPVNDLDKPWVPNNACLTCYNELQKWSSGKNEHLKYVTPRIWRKPTNHVDECYFCKAVPPSLNKPGSYPSLPSSTAPIPWTPEVIVPTAKLLEEISSSSTLASESATSMEQNEYIVPGLRNAHYPNQKEIDDLIRDLGLTKTKGELLTSRLKQWDLLDKDVRICSQRTRHDAYSTFYTYEDGVCFCHDVCGLFEKIGYAHKADEWRLFIDSSSKSLKAVLLHNTNELPSIPVAHSKTLKENYESTKKLLECLKYDEHKWEVIGDFKMIAFLMGLQGGNTKFPCFVCHWDSRDTKNHYIKYDWTMRSEDVQGQHNIKFQALVDRQKILMPPLHLKLGLMKQFVKALGADSNALKYLKDKYPKMSDGKVTAGIFTGPQIRTMLNDPEFMEKLNETEKNAWLSFKAVAENFLGNKKSPEYKTLVANLVQTYRKMNCRMSLKLHILDAHLDKFKENMGSYSEEHGERFHQDIKGFEARYNRQCNEAMMGDYINSLVVSSPGAIFNRQAARKTFKHVPISGLIV